MKTKIHSFVTEIFSLLTTQKARLQSINPKLPMRNRTITKCYYCYQPWLYDNGLHDFENYLMLAKDQIESHFIEHKTPKIAQKCGQV